LVRELFHLFVILELIYNVCKCNMNMKIKKIIILLLLSSLLTACGLIKNQEKDQIITTPQADFSSYKAFLLKKLYAFGVQEFKYQPYAARGFSTFKVDYQGRNDLSIAFSIPEDGYSIFCYFPGIQAQSLPTDFDLNIIIAILHSLDEKAVNYKTLSSFFLAADSEYLPNDYEMVMSQPFPAEFDNTEKVLSYKYRLIGSCNLQLQVTDKGSSYLWLYSYTKLPQEDTLHYAKSIKGVLEYYNCMNWTYSLYETFFADLNDNSQLYISLSSEVKNSLFFSPRDLNFGPITIRQLSKQEDSFSTINVNLLAELCAILQPDTSLADQLSEFLFDASGLYDFPLAHPLGELIARCKTFSVNSKNINFNYYLENSLNEILSIELRDE